MLRRVVVSCLLVGHFSYITQSVKAHLLCALPIVWVFFSIDDVSRIGCVVVRWHCTAGCFIIILCIFDISGIDCVQL